MTKKAEQGQTAVPESADLQEPAAFWDEHSLFDFPEHFEEVGIGEIRPSRKRGITVK